jgi:hypothetical protein
MCRTFLRYGKSSAEMPVIRKIEMNCMPPPTRPASWFDNQSTSTINPIAKPSMATVRFLTGDA